MPPTPSKPASRSLNNPVLWHFDFQLTFLFEIDVAAIEKKLPRGSYPLEVRPGVGLLLVGAQRAPAGNLGDMPAFQEVDWTIAVQPDLSRDMPTPRFAFAQGFLASANPQFAHHAHRVDKMITDHVPSLRGSFHEESLSVDFADERGPIMAMRSTHRMPPVFTPRTFWGQQTTTLDDGTWSQAWSWSGLVFEHQQGYGQQAAVFHQHPMFDGIDVSGIGDQCYMQIVSKPSARIDFTFYEPVRLF